MKKALTVATILCSIAVPCFAQSFDPDAGSGNIVPFATNQGGANAYAMAPDRYENRYSRAQASRRIHHPSYRAPKMIDRDYSND